MKFLKTYLLVALLAFGSLSTSRASDTPTKPTKYFNDFANVVPTAKATEFNDRLAQYERETSNQFLVVVFPELPQGYELASYTNAMAREWQIGQKDKNNGVLLAVFLKSYEGNKKGRIRFEVGYGLEGALPDIRTKNIIDTQISPHFRERDFAGGFDAAITSVIHAAQGEYAGAGRTVTEQKHDARVSPTPAKELSNKQKKIGAGLGGVFLLIIGIMGIGIIGLILRHLRKKTQEENELKENARNQSAEWYASTRPPACAPVQRPYSSREYLKEVPATTPRPLSIAPFVAGAAAGVLAEELLSSSRRRKTTMIISPSSSSSLSHDSSDSSSSSSYDSGSSFSSSDFSSGGGDFGGGGSSGDF